VLFSRTSLQYDRPPPPLGADTDEVLGQRLGLDPMALAALRSRGVVA
jgi:crotonobetainyl-CoA:carnitine CoA-transferase CaiB-like acyl-CoA transferase